MPFRSIVKVRACMEANERIFFSSAAVDCFKHLYIFKKLQCNFHTLVFPPSSKAFTVAQLLNAQKPIVYVGHELVFEIAKTSPISFKFSFGLGD